MYIFKIWPSVVMKDNTQLLLSSISVHIQLAAAQNHTRAHLCQQHMFDDDECFCCSMAIYMFCCRTYYYIAIILMKHDILAHVYLRFRAIHIMKTVIKLSVTVKRCQFQFSQTQGVVLKKSVKLQFNDFSQSRPCAASELKC